MLVEKVTEVTTLKLQTGDEVITRIVKETAEDYECEQCITMAATAQGIALVPWIQTGNSKSISINKKHNILVPPTVLCNGCEILPVHGQGRIYNLVAFSKTANVLYVKFSQDIYPNCFYRTIKSAADLWNVITEKVINNYKIKISINHMDRLMENWNNTKGRTLFWPILQGFHRNFENNYQLKAIEIWKACQENPIRLGETIIYL